MRNQVIEEIVSKKVIAIVRGYFGDECVNLARALHEGGIDLLEATFDPLDAENRRKTAETIKKLNERLGDVMTFGAGTVTSVDMVLEAKAAGARFIVSPNTNKAVIEATVDADMVSIPGALTPTEIKFAHDCGGDFIKVFPASSMGYGYFKNLHAPLSDCRLLAVGGVNNENAADYMNAGCYGIGVAGCLFKKEWIKAGAWDKITNAAMKFTNLLNII